MKVVIAGSKELVALHIGQFFRSQGYEVLFLVNKPQKEEDLSFEKVQSQGLIQCDALINLPQKMLLKHKMGTPSFEKEFFETRIEPTTFLKKAILKAPNPPKVWVSFSSIGCYSKEMAKFYKETDPLGTDSTAMLIQKWEEAARLPEDFETRTVISRLGLLISQSSGLLPVIRPLFRFGLGSIMGHGDEAFPWIYKKDLYWFLHFALSNSSMKGAYNTVAPQCINSREFSLALSKVMHKPILFKFPRRFFYKRLGDAAEIVFARTMVFPSRLLKSGFEFRYPAIYPALVDCLSQGSHFLKTI